MRRGVVLRKGIVPGAFPARKKSARTRRCRYFLALGLILGTEMRSQKPAERNSRRMPEAMGADFRFSRPQIQSEKSPRHGGHFPRLETPFFGREMRIRNALRINFQCAP